MAHTYMIQNTECTSEEVDDWFNCKFCLASIRDAKVHLHEDQFGEFFCEDKECVWLHVSECDTVEIESIIDDGEEEE